MDKRLADATMSNPVHDWKLVDDSNPRFNVWESIYGYKEAFRKGMDPNYSTVSQYDRE